MWYLTWIMTATWTPTAAHGGLAEDLPVAGDFDKDGYVDEVALYRTAGPGVRRRISAARRNTGKFGKWNTAALRPSLIVIIGLPSGERNLVGGVIIYPGPPPGPG
jgi:hypothetical protein